MEQPPHSRSRGKDVELLQIQTGQALGKQANTIQPPPENCRAIRRGYLVF